MPWQWVTPEQGVHIAQITNDAALEAHASMPDRFVFGLELPVGYAKGALAELNRVGGKKGLACTLVDTKGPVGGAVGFVYTSHLVQARTTAGAKSKVLFEKKF